MPRNPQCLPLNESASLKCSNGDCDRPTDDLPHSTDSLKRRDFAEVSGAFSSGGKGHSENVPRTSLGRHIETCAQECTEMPNAKRRRHNVARRRTHRKNRMCDYKKGETEKSIETVTFPLLSVSHNALAVNVLSHSLYKLQIKPGLTKPETEHKKVPVPVDSIMFDRLEFQRLNEEYGPFTLDGAAAMYDAQVPNYCACDRPFETTDVKGQTVFLNPPFSKALEMLKHFESERQESPLDTRAVIILPQWTSKYAASYRRITDKYKRIHTYPTGTFLFQEPTKTGCTPLGPTPWPVDVFLADSTVEEREVQSYESAKLTEHLKSLHVFNRKTSSGKLFKSLPQDRFTIHQLSSQSPSDLLIVQPTVNCDKVFSMTSLIDSGATMDFTDRTFVDNNNI